jgi:hypothetical protein
MEGPRAPLEFETSRLILSAPTAADVEAIFPNLAPGVPQDTLCYALTL